MNKRILIPTIILLSVAIGSVVYITNSGSNFQSGPEKKVQIEVYQVGELIFFTWRYYGLYRNSSVALFMTDGGQMAFGFEGSIVHMRDIGSEGRNYLVLNFNSTYIQMERK